MDFNVQGGVFLGTTLLQARGQIGGARSVFVKLQGVKNDLQFPPIGGVLKNPFKGRAKMYAGDLMEYRTDETGMNPVLYLLKTFEVADTVEEAGTTVKVVADGYHHIPFTGDVLMKAPSTLAGTGVAATVTAVTKEDGVYMLTLSSAIGELEEGDILVEAVEAGSGKAMLVSNPNTFCPCDYDMFYEPASGDDDFDGAKYLMNPVLHGTAFIHKMSPVPDAVLSERNKSRVNGWFEL